MGFIKRGWATQSLRLLRDKGIGPNLRTPIFTRPALQKILDDLEKVSTRSDPALRTFVESRVAYIESIRAEWDK